MKTDNPIVDLEAVETLLWDAHQDLGDWLQYAGAARRGEIKTPPTPSGMRTTNALRVRLFEAALALQNRRLGRPVASRWPAEGVPGYREAKTEAAHPPKETPAPGTAEAQKLRERLIQRIDENTALLCQVGDVRQIWLEWRENGIANAIAKGPEYLARIGKIVEPEYPTDRLRDDAFTRRAAPGTPSEAAGDLEAMFAQGEIIGYEIDRMPGKASVRLEWMEYAENCPEGWSSTGRGYGPDVPAALEAAKKKMPRKDPQ